MGSDTILPSQSTKVNLRAVLVRSLHDCGVRPEQLTHKDKDIMMANSIKEKIEETGHTIAEKANEIGHKLGEKAEVTKDWVKEKAHQTGNRIEEMTEKVTNSAKETFGETGPAGTTTDIAEHMDVITSCGTKIGRVDHVQGSQIKLTKNDSADGQHHLIPTSWVARVDSHVHLNKTCGEAKSEWQSA